MQEIKIKNNPSGLKIFINGVPQIELIHKEQLGLVVKALDKQIDKHFSDISNRVHKK